MSKFFQKYGMITGGLRPNIISYPDWGYMIKSDDYTLKCFIFEPENENIDLYGFDPTYISSVRVFDADNEFSDSNYEKTDFGIKIFNSLKSFSYDEFIDDFNTTITNNANLGVIEIKFSQPVVVIGAKPLKKSKFLTPRCFSIGNNATKKYRNNIMTISGKGSCYTEFIWDDETGIYNIDKTISIGSDTNNAGKITIKDCTNSKNYEFILNNIASDSIDDTILLINGHRYNLKIERTDGSSSTQNAITFSKISFEPNLSDITYTQVDHITAT